MSKTVEDILHKLNEDAKKERASCTERGNWEGYNFKYNRLESEAVEAINQLLIEAKIEEVKSIWNKHGRNLKTTLTDDFGNVYNEDEKRYISSYEVQERLFELQQTLKGDSNV